MPGPFALDRVREAVVGTRFATVDHVVETGSTNADLLAAAADGDGEGRVLVADHQTAGRGRRGRTWDDVPGRTLLVSVLLRPPAASVDLVTPAVAVAAAEAVEAVVGVAPSIKWPNDLVASVDGGPERKLAGILAEASWPPGADIASGWPRGRERTRVPVVVGMGLNVSADGRAEELDPIAVALDELTGPAGAPAPTREAVVAAWLVALDRWYPAALDDDDRDRLWAAWRDRSATLGRRVRVDLGVDDLTGTAVDVTDGGQLVVRTDEGVDRVLAVGDVTHVRAAG
ncbi:MAG: biotin--[acetyl-CoA-carboxylase] ligase [Acidimicrobiales bacterium]|nr:biotin--[acetyl-CoA-carboxylase] ligase [Acidimicrobiales bacterium]